MGLQEMDDEPLAGYRDAVRRRLQELMLRESYPPGHPLVVSTGHHLEMSSAFEASERYSAPNIAQFFRGCDLFYTNSNARPPTPTTPDENVPPVLETLPAKLTI